MDFELNRYASFSKFNYLPFLQKKRVKTIKMKWHQRVFERARHSNFAKKILYTLHVRMGLNFAWGARDTK